MKGTKRSHTRGTITLHKIHKRQSSDLKIAESKVRVAPKRRSAESERTTGERGDLCRMRGKRIEGDPRGSTLSALFKPLPVIHLLFAIRNLPASARDMSSKILFVAVLVVVGVAIVAAHPRPSPYSGREVRQVDLGEAINKTVCPIVVEIDEDLQRIPKRIKMVRCAAHPQRVCRDRNIPDNECCAHMHNHHVMECVELRDKVLVTYPQSDSTVKTKVFDVAVGCTCMLSRSLEASTIPPAT